MYQVGLVFQAGDVTLWVNESVEIGTCDMAMKWDTARRNVRREVGREMLLIYPPVAVAVRLERLGGLRQGLFDRRTAVTVIERKCGDVDQRRNIRIVAGLGDDGPAITVADENHRPAHGVDGGLRVLMSSA